MDPRRLLTLSCAALTLAGCASLRPPGAPAARPAEPVVAEPAPQATPTAPPPLATMAPIPNPPVRGPAPPLRASHADDATPSRAAPEPPRTARPSSGRTAIAAANAAARETSRADAFVGGVQVFAYAPGRVYEVWTAPLRVTTLTLAPGETVVSMAAGDTVRWQIGETGSGEGSGRRAHVMIKPLERGLETNLVLATSARVYLLQLRSGPPETFNAAVAWDVAAVLSPAAAALLTDAERTGPPPQAAPAGRLDARFSVRVKGRRPAWTPTAVMTDGRRTFLTFPAHMESAEAPVLLVIAPGGEAQVVNYRQQGGLWVVDRVFEEAELRLGGKRPQWVRIVRQSAARAETQGNGS